MVNRTLRRPNQALNKIRDRPKPQEVYSGNEFKQIDGVTFNAIAIAITSTSTVAVTVIERWATQESASWVI
jgi:hypothetical protein